MDFNNLSELSDEKLEEIAKGSKPSPIWDAFFIGFLIGILFYGLTSNAWGFIAILPLYLIYLFLKKPKQYKAIQAELKKRRK